MDINETASPADGHLLVLGASEERLQLVLGQCRDGKAGLLTAQEWIVPSRAMGVLAPALEQAFKLLRITPADLGGIACVYGPGSFTGIRIILSTAMGFLGGSRTPLAGLNHLQTLAVSAPPLAPAASLAVLTYARRGQVYLQAFDPETRQPLDGWEDVRALTAQQARGLLDSLPQPVATLGTGLRRNPEVFADIASLPQDFDTPKADALLRMAAQARYARAPIAPCYVRPSDAEENLEHIASLRGLSLDEAQKRIDLSLEDMIIK
ncbi:MAG: tRNA (adenosine(37)-N6)-threonylcarbamoyltransferase complex dimerization subunit type 1 TsaB [Desulfovibrio sp.]|uniref:tRNA (adenosine(37)-N6)-threonylcarbamoyltransferase complex dimerization subunit type 1 TsaB n=1 Tax=Desulfovibrio sp. 7SRBS1 TaxID=3378064 RepID=UPI003B3DE400